MVYDKAKNGWNRDWETDNISAELCPKRHDARCTMNQDILPKIVAYRVKDYADGWILCHTLSEALEHAKNGNLIQGLVVIED
jgi:hypothetical protein